MNGRSTVDSPLQLLQDKTDGGRALKEAALEQPTGAHGWGGTGPLVTMGNLAPYKVGEVWLTMWWFLKP